MTGKSDQGVSYSFSQEADSSIMLLAAICCHKQCRRYLCILCICKALLQTPVGLIPAISGLGPSQLPFSSLHSHSSLLAGSLGLVFLSLGNGQPCRHALLGQLLNGHLNLQGICRVKVLTGQQALYSDAALFNCRCC